MSKPVIFKPSPSFGHPGDGFRKLIDLWSASGFVEVKESPNRYCWWGEPGKILLHDHHRVFDVVRDLPPYEFGLFGNMAPKDERPDWNDSRDHRWIFWCRYTDLVQQNIQEGMVIPPKDRYLNSIFLGRVENDLQTQNRFQSRIDWTKHIDLIRIVRGLQTPHPYPPKHYLIMMSRSVYALLLPGYGNKCHRDLEAVAMGCVPVVTPGVDVVNYHEPMPIFAEVKTDQEASELFENIDRYDREKFEMYGEQQKELVSWWFRNSSVRGSFLTTQKIVKSLMG